MNAAGFSEKECRVETEITSQSSATNPDPVQEPLKEAPQEEQEEFLNFNDADIERVLKDRQNEAAQGSGRSAVDEMLAAAEQAGQNYADTMEQAGASDPNLSWEVKNKMQNFFIKPEFRDEIKALRLPQFVRTVPGNIFKQGFTTFLERESIAEVFSLKGKASDIDFSNADTQMVYVDVRDQSGVVPKVYKMSSAEQQAVKDFLAKASPQARIARCKKMLYDHLSKMKGIDEGEMRQYVNRIVDDMTDEQREGLEKSPAAYALKIKAKIEGLLEEHYEKTFNEWLETDLIQCQDLYAFPDFIHPAESDSMIGGSLYEAEEAMNGLERELALELTAIPSVRWWHRNIADKEGFRINGFINHYPDIIVMTQKGTVVLVETKGEHLKNDDSAQKARVGRAWQNTAGKGYRYYMVFRDTDPKEDGMISMSDFLRILQQL